MRRLTNFLIALPLVGLFLIYATVKFVSYELSEATKHCPLRHKFSDLAVCEILDERAGARLIQHADLDLNTTYLEIQRDNDSEFFAVPQLGKNAHIIEPARLAKLQPPAVIAFGRLYSLRRINGPTF